jgi:ribose transport system substrate-binding protein
MRENNYQERLQGIREQLRGSETQVEVRAADRLSGENGWSEPNRCPLFRAEKPEKAVFQLVALLKAQKVDVIISTGSWPIYHADVFRQQLSPLLAELDKKGKRPTIIIASNEPDAAKRALLDDGLIQAYLSLEGREIGRQSYRILKRLAQGESVPEKVFVDSRIYLPKVSTAIPIAPREGVSQ